MSYAVSAALQAAVYQALTADVSLGALVGNAIYDEVPPGILPDTYVVLGGESVRDRSDQTGRGALHRLSISVVTDQAGFRAAKRVAGAVSDALNDAPLTLERGRLVHLHFYRAQARREGTGAQRRIDLIFRARVDDPQ
jgi:hypothetical protein